MRYTADHKEKTRTKMIGSASRCFRAHGYSGIGVDGLAKAAGVTSGAFYSHFGSKEDAFNDAVAEGLDEVIKGIPKFQQEHGADWVIFFAKYYLSKSHRDDLACGCAMATLTPEVVRSGPNVQKAFEKKMLQIAKLVAKGLSGNSEEDRDNRAWAMLSVLIGGINVARAMKSKKTSEIISEATANAAVKTAGRSRAVKDF